MLVATSRRIPTSVKKTARCHRISGRFFPEIFICHLGGEEGVVVGGLREEGEDEIMKCTTIS